MSQPTKEHVGMWPPRLMTDRQRTGRGCGVLCVLQRDEVALDVHLKSSHCSRLQIRLDVSWVQVGNAHKKSWSRESPEFTKAKTRVLYERGREIPMIIASALLR